MELVDVMLGLLVAARPDEGAAAVVDLEHQRLGLGARITEHAHEYHRHVAHKIDRVIVDDDIPRGRELVLRLDSLNENRAGLPRFRRRCHALVTYQTPRALPTLARFG